MTSIEWLIEQFNLQAYSPHIEQAKEMHKEEIKNAWDNRNKDVIKSDGKTAEQYYQETFKKD